MSKPKTLNSLSYELSYLKNTLKSYEQMQVDKGRMLLDLQKQLRKLEDGYCQLSAPQWLQLNAISCYNRIDYMRNLVEEANNEICHNEIKIDRLRSWEMELCRKFRNSYKVVSLRV